MRSDPFTGRYLFHLHTTYTDGHVPVRDYFALALRKGLDRLIFLEHIRAQPRYDVSQFITEVRSCAAEFGVEALVGFEAKLLPGGGLDISEEHAAQAEVLGLAEHGFPGDYALWRSSLCRALESCATTYADKPVVWVHPGLWLKKQGLLQSNEPDYRALVAHAQDLGIKVEWNLRYGLLPPQLHEAVRAESLVRGADAHRLDDAEAAVQWP
jgi:histidinol phosphatase-like PHP family hydrolase